MLPTLSPGKNVLVRKTWFFCHVKAGDIVVVKDPRNGRLLIKRVKLINEYGQLFVIGDNKSESTDSRVFGWIDRKNAIGKVSGR